MKIKDKRMFECRLYAENGAQGTVKINGVDYTLDDEETVHILLPAGESRITVDYGFTTIVVDGSTVFNGNTENQPDNFPFMVTGAVFINIAP